MTRIETKKKKENSEEAETFEMHGEYSAVTLALKRERETQARMRKQNECNKRTD